VEQLQVNLIAFLGALEFALVAVVIAIGFGLRGRRLANRVRALELKARQVKPVAEAVSYEQYLRDEVLRNQELIERADAAQDVAERNVGGLFAMRKRFLEIELEARELETNPVAFQARIADGMQALIEQLRPEPETVSGETEVAADVQASVEPDPSPGQESSVPRETHDTHDEEIDHLKQVINNQQDAMAALRTKLREFENEHQGAEDVLQKLDEFERRSNELQRCLQVLEQENERLKSVRLQRHTGAAGTQPEQLNGLRSMVGEQQHTIAKLQSLINKLAPEAGKARELADAFSSMQHANQELNGCVAVLEDENALLRSELEQIQAKVARHEADAGQGEGDGGQQAAEAGLSEQNHELEVKVQELEALLEFKDAAIQELEKQYNILESKYLAASGQKKA
jgi:predicted RNase H-like nuclease (RuvC/YqgF family)